MQNFRFHFLITFICLHVLFAACSSTRNSIRSDERDLNTLINRLNKRGADDKVIADIKDVYDNALQRSTEHIGNYRVEQEPQKWEKIISEMEALQRMYQTIARSAYALRQVRPVNYAVALRQVKDTAAEAFYQYGLQRMQSDDRAELRQAYRAFQQAAAYVPQYKNSRTLMQEVFDKATVHVLINLIQYEDIGWNNWNMGFFNSRDRQWQNRLINELGGRSRSATPASFYDEYELKRLRQAPDWVVDIIWRNMRFDVPMEQTRTVQRSRQIEIGRDTAGRPIDQTVYATLFITQRLLNADADLNLNITDVVNRRTIVWDRFPADFRYRYEFASFTGDKRALTSEDIILINRSQNQPLPSKEDALHEMLERVYPQVLNRIRQAVAW
jgi:hypothetical protein